MCWCLGKTYLDFRTAQNERAIPTPVDNLWRANAFGAFRGKPKRDRPKEDDLSVRAPMSKWIFVDIGVSWPPLISRSRGPRVGELRFADLPLAARRVLAIGGKFLLITTYTGCIPPGIGAIEIAHALLPTVQMKDQANLIARAQV